MKKIGIVGGAAWPSTLEYYRLICEGANRHFRDRGVGAPLPTPPMTIESIVSADIRALRGREGDEDSWAGFDAVIRDALLRLQAASCDFALIANNTMHTRLHAITRGVDMEVLSILDAAAKAAAGTGARQALVLGTSVTMRSDAYARALDRVGIAANDRLPEGEIDALQEHHDTTFFGPEVATEGRALLLDLCRRHVADPDGTAVLLACTELPLAFPDHAGEPVYRVDGFTFIDTVAAHVDAALARALH